MRSASILGAKCINRRITRALVEEIVRPRSQRSSAAVPATALAPTLMEVVRAEVVVAVCLTAAVDGLEELDLGAVCSRLGEAITVGSCIRTSNYVSISIPVIGIRARGGLHVFELASGGRARLVLFLVFWMYSVIGIVLGTLPVLASDVATGVALAEVAGIVHVMGSRFSAAADETNCDGSSIFGEVTAVAGNRAFVSSCLRLGGHTGGRRRVSSIFKGLGGRKGGRVRGIECGVVSGGGIVAEMYVARFVEFELGGASISGACGILQHGTRPGLLAATTSETAFAPSTDRGHRAIGWAGGIAAAVRGCAHGFLTGTAVRSDSQDGATVDLEGLNAAGGRACGPLCPGTKGAVSCAGSGVAINADFFPIAVNGTSGLTFAGSTTVATMGGDLTLANLLSVAAAWFVSCRVLANAVVLPKAG